MPALAAVKPVEAPAERVLPGKTVLPQTLLMGNGRYSVMVTNSGWRLQPLEPVRYYPLAGRLHAATTGAAFVSSANRVRNAAWSATRSR